jgi:putative ABC transport system permease protein
MSDDIYDTIRDTSGNKIEHRTNPALNQTLLLAFRNVVRQRRRTALAISSVIFGVAALMLTSGFIEWNLWFGRESTIHSQLGHIRVHKPHFLDSGLADPFAYLLPDDRQQIQKIEAIPHVVTLAPRLSFNGLISRGDATISFIGEGVDPEREVLLSRSVTTVQGEPLAATDPAGIVLGQGLAANLGVKPGDKVVLVVNTARGGVNAVDATVRGLFATITKAYDDSALRIPIALARRLLKVEGAHSYALLLDKTENTDSGVAQLRSEFKGAALEFVPWHELADFYKKTSELFSRQIGVVRMIIAAIIVLSISNSMVMGVLERTGEIGTSMALGYRRKAVLALFLCEGFLLGLIGGLVGLVISFFAAEAISAIGIPMPPPPGMAFGYTAGIMLTWPMAVQALMLAVGTTLAASAYPAWKAARLEIVDALRKHR